MKHPAVLTVLVEEYEALRALRAGTPDDRGSGPSAEDIAHTLCVSTRTRDVEAALAVARRGARGL